MRGIAEITLADHTFTVRELTYPQIVQQIKTIKEEEGEPGELDWLFGKKYMPQATIEAIIGEDLDAIMKEKDLAPSQIEPLYKKAVEINPFLAGALQEMRQIAEMIRMSLPSMSANLSNLFAELPSSLLDGATTNRKDTDSATSSKS